MRREESQRNRLERILEGDKEEMNEGSRRAALRDFQRLASEYFDLEDEPILKTERTAKGLEVSFTFRATRVKNFTLIRG